MSRMLQSVNSLINQQKIGGSLASTQPGRFEFILNPYVDSHSKKIGVRERQYTTNIRQGGQFIPDCCNRPFYSCLLSDLAIGWQRG